MQQLAHIYYYSRQTLVSSARAAEKLPCALAHAFAFQVNSADGIAHATAEFPRARYRGRAEENTPTLLPRAHAYSSRQDRKFPASNDGYIIFAEYKVSNSGR